MYSGVGNEFKCLKMRIRIEFQIVRVFCVRGLFWKWRGSIFGKGELGCGVMFSFFKKCDIKSMGCVIRCLFRKWCKSYLKNIYCSVSCYIYFFKYKIKTFYLSYLGKLEKMFH